MTSVLETRNVKRAYQMGNVTVSALRGVSLEIEEGDFVAILGPSGSGKSTLLHVLGGLDRPDEGEVLIDGTSLYTLNDNKRADVRLRKIGFVFRFFNLLPGDFSGIAKQASYIEKGEIKYALKETMISGNAFHALMNIVEIGSESRPTFEKVYAPPILIDRVNVVSKQT